VTGAAQPEPTEIDREALAFARNRAQALGLAVKLFRVERPPETAGIVFFLSAAARVELKELAQALAERYPEGLELRQVGVRDEAKLVGGIGSCGRELCCTTFLPRFEPVTIRMAKHQNLALNPARVTGQCGRLKCCLVYEEAQYLQAADPRKPG
jgi:cell fate regulator YaaT (PSP1 superfamily)